MRLAIARALSAVTLGFAVAACGATASPSPTADPSLSPAMSSGIGPSASPAVNPSLSPAISSGIGPSASPAVNPSPVPSVDHHGAPDLEARLPSVVGGTPLTTVSLTGEAFLSTGSETGRGQLEALLVSLGKGPSDLSVAQAADPTGVLDFQAGLFRVAGADPDRLLDEWVSAQQAATSNRLEISNAEIGGHQTTKLVDPAHVDAGPTYTTLDGDTLVIVRTLDEALAVEVFSAI